MGKFYKGQHYSTQSNLGPNERFGVEDDMSFHDLAINLDNQSSKKVVKPNLSKTNEELQVSPDKLQEIIKKQQNEIYNLKKENESLLNEKRDLIERNKNILSLKSNNIEDLKSENQKLKKQLENLSNKDTITNIDVIGGVNSKYTEGVYIDSFEGQYGTILKFSINLKRFSQNNKVTPKGYVYFEVKKAQSGKYYATPQKYFN